MMIPRKLLNIPLLSEAFARLPLVVVDIGASGGMQKQCVSVPAPLRYIGFEPDAEEHRKLVKNADPNRELYLNMGVAATAGERDFHVTRLQACSSLLEPNSEFIEPFRPKDFEVVKTIRVAV